MLTRLNIEDVLVDDSVALRKVRGGWVKVERMKASLVQGFIESRRNLFAGPDHVADPAEPHSHPLHPMRPLVGPTGCA